MQHGMQRCGNPVGWATKGQPWLLRVWCSAADDLAHYCALLCRARESARRASQRLSLQGCVVLQTPRAYECDFLKGMPCTVVCAVVCIQAAVWEARLGTGGEGGADCGTVSRRPAGAAAARPEREAFIKAKYQVEVHWRQLKPTWSSNSVRINSVRTRSSSTHALRSVPGVPVRLRHPATGWGALRCTGGRRSCGSCGGAGRAGGVWGRGQAVAAGWSACPTASSTLRSPGGEPSLRRAGPHIAELSVHSIFHSHGGSNYA